MQHRIVARASEFYLQDVRVNPKFLLSKDFGEAMNLKKRVLIASANEEIRNAILDVLPEWSLETVFASDAVGAQRILQGQPVALAFCDQELAAAAWQDLITAASARKPTTRLIMLVSDEKQYAEMDSNGVFDAIPYPCRRSDLQWVIFQALRDLEKPRRRFEDSNALRFQRITSANPGPASV
jgi:DNA-binding NtrC family response regulator